MIKTYSTKISQLSFFFCLLFIASSCEKETPDTTGETPVSVSISELSLDEGAEAEVSKAFVRIRLGKEATELITVYVSTEDGTATQGEDYLSFENMPIVFEPGDKNKDFQISIIGDDEAEQDENFKLNISNIEGNAIADEDSALITILNDDKEPVPLFIPTTGFTTPESRPGMNLIWQDEFSGANIDANNWTFEIGRGNNGWGNEELQFYQRQNSSIVSGNLVIEAREESVGNPYTSSRMITENKFDFLYGRVDIRAALPKGQGIWPALWMLGTNIRTVGWPSCGEIDIMEIVGHEPAKLHGTAHWSNGGSKADFGGSTTLPSGTFNDQFHVFSIIWTENRIQWLLNDVKYHELSTSPATMDEFRKNQFFIFNVAVGGIWPGSPDASTQFPQRMIVDYIRVFQEQ